MVTKGGDVQEEPVWEASFVYYLREEANEINEFFKLYNWKKWIIVFLQC